ncbi:MAG: hypothetical protein AB3N19_09775, partial [Ruegeria sp.]
MGTFARVSGEKITRLVFQSISVLILAMVALLLVRPALAQVSPPTFTKTFTPDVIGTGGVSTITFNITNIAAVPVTAIAFTDVLPAAPGAMTIASPANASVSNCDAGSAVPTLTAPDGGGTITFSGGAVGVGQTCTITVDVTASTTGTYTNTTGDLTSSAGNSGTATDDLTVATDRPAFSKVFSPDSVPLGGRSTLTFTIDNSLNAGDLSSLVFTDTFPPGMEVANPANASHTCVGPNPQLTAVAGSNSVSFESFGLLFPGFEVLLAGAVCNVTVDVIGTALGTHNNVSSDLTTNVGSSGKASDALTVTGGGLIIGKEFTDDPVVAGGNVTLEFTIQNVDRNFSATGVAFTDDLTTLVPALAGLTFDSLLSNDCGGSVSGVGGTTVGLSGGTIAPEGTCTLRVSLAVPGGAASNTHTNTTSAVTGTVNGSPVVGNTASDGLIVQSTAGSAPTLTATFTPSSAAAGGTAVLEYTITNTSTSMVTDISFFTDFLVVFPTASVTPGNGLCGAGSTSTFTPLIIPGPPSSVIPARLTIADGELAPAGSPGDSCTFSITLDVLAAAAAGSYTQTTSDLTSTVDSNSLTTSAASDDLLINGGANLSFTKSFSGPATTGSTVDLTFNITSSAESAPASSIDFTDDLDAMLTGTTVAMAGTDTCGGTPAGAGSGTFSYTGGSLGTGASCQITVSINIPAGALPGAYTNTTSDLTAMASGVPVTIPPATADLLVSGLEFTKEYIDDPVVAGDTATLRFTIDNTGAADATGMFFTDSLNANLAGLAAVAPLPTNPCGGGSAISGTTFLIFTGGNLTAGTSCSFNVTVQVPPAAASGGYGNTTSNLIATVGGSVVTIPPATDTLLVDSVLLQITKEFTDDPVAPGDQVTLQFTLENTGTSAVSDITFGDDLEAVLPGAPDLSATAAPVNTCGGMGNGFPTGNFTYTGGSLTAGATCTVTLTVDVPPGAAPGDYLNITTGIAGNMGGLFVNGDPASDILTIRNSTSTPDFTKSFSGPSVPGGTPTLTFNITNNDTVNSLSGLGFSDNLDDVITGLVATGTTTNTCGGTVSGTSLISLVGGTLAPSASCMIVVDLSVPVAATAGTYPNTTSELQSTVLTVAG